MPSVMAKESMLFFLISAFPGSRRCVADMPETWSRVPHQGVYLPAMLPRDGDRIGDEGECVCRLRIVMRRRPDTLKRPDSNSGHVSCNAGQHKAVKFEVVTVRLLLSRHGTALSCPR